MRIYQGKKKQIKATIALIGAFLINFGANPVSAQTPPKSIVIIDTALNSALPEFKDKIVYELCMVQTGTCSNGRMVNKGNGSAGLLPNQSYVNGFEHGNMMALIATQVNPDIKIVFIRVAGTLSNGRIGSFSEVSITRALDWVLNNHARFNIVSVSASVGNTVYNSTGNYCPIKATHNVLISNIDKLKDKGIATMFAAGNNRDQLRVNFPACIPQAIAVSAVNGFSSDDGWKVSPLVNRGPDVDFYALGSFNTSQGSTGLFGQTSPATVALSAYWARNYKGNYADTYNFLRAQSSLTLKDFVDVLK